MLHLKKKTGLLLVAAMLLQLLLPAAALADMVPPDELNHGDGFLVIHGTQPTPDTHIYDAVGGWSSIEVKDGATSILPSASGIYENVPDGASIKIKYALHLEPMNEDGDVIYDYSTKAHTFRIVLPAGIRFTTPLDSSIPGDSFNIIAEGGWIWAMGQLQPDGTILITLNNTAITAENSSDLWASLEFNGIFLPRSEGNGNDTQIVLGTQTYTFVREEPDYSDIGLQKSGVVYDPATGQLVWTITVDPGEVALDGLELTDSYSLNQSYVADSFYVKKGSADPVKINESNIEKGSNEITYTFPSGSAGVHVITYRTAPDFGAETGADTNAESVTFTNVASLIDPLDGNRILVTDDDRITANWVNKAVSDKIQESDGEIYFDWTVTVNVPGSGTVKGASITDAIPAGLELVAGSVTITHNGVTNGTVGTVLDANGKYEISSSSLIYTFPGADQALVNTATLKYRTKVTDRDAGVNNNGAIEFNNTAGLSWTGMTGDAPKDTATGIVGAGGLVNKSAAGGTVNYTYDTNGTYIQWVITVNENRVNMPGANSITDETGSGQELFIDSEHPFVVTRYTNSTSVSGDSITSKASIDDFTYIASPESFSYILPNDIPAADHYTISYYTKLTEDGIKELYGQGSIGFGNTVDLNGTTASGTKMFNSQLIDKSNGVHDYDTKATTWTIQVNRNQLPLNGAVLTDTLPAGIVLSGESPVTVSPALPAGSITAADGGNGFSVSFGNIPAGRAYTVTVTTRFTEEALKAANKNDITLTNIAELSYKDNTGADRSANDSGTVTVKNPVLKKWHEGTNSEIKEAGIIGWGAYLNLGRITLNNASVSDTLNAGIGYVAGSAKLYKLPNAAFNADGTMSTEGVRQEVALAAGDITYTGNVLTVKLPGGEGSNVVFLLEFETEVIDDTLDIQNTISLTGATNGTVNGSDGARVQISGYLAIAGGGSTSFTLVKTSEQNGQGIPVSGATYRLVNAKGVPITRSGANIEVATDANGRAVFINLPNRTFYALEVAAPAGYSMSSTPIPLVQNGTVTTYDEPLETGVTTVAINKVSAGGQDLNGGSFGMYTVTPGEDVMIETLWKSAQSIGGKVTFTGVPVGNYVIREIAAPSGYSKTSDAIGVTVTFADGSATAEYHYIGAGAELDGKTLVNAPIPYTPGQGATVRIYKVDSVNSKPLAGAEFTLYDSFGKAVKTTVTNENGYAWFMSVPAGSYTVKETKTPIGYMASADPLAVQAADGGNYEFTVQNAPTKAGVPATGDAGSMWGYALIGSALLLGTAALRRRRTDA